MTTHTKGREMDTTEGLRAEDPIHAALEAWRTGRAYVDNGGNYRLYELDPTSPRGKKRGRIAWWNKEAKQAFPEVFDLHHAAVREGGKWS